MLHRIEYEKTQVTLIETLLKFVIEPYQKSPSFRLTSDTQIVEI